MPLLNIAPTDYEKDEINLKQILPRAQIGDLFSLSRLFHQ